MNKIITVKKRTADSGFESMDIYVNGTYIGNIFTDGKSLQTTMHISKKNHHTVKIVQTKDLESFYGYQMIVGDVN